MTAAFSAALESEFELLLASRAGSAARLGSAPSSSLVDGAEAGGERVVPEVEVPPPCEASERRSRVGLCEAVHGLAEGRDAAVGAAGPAVPGAARGIAEGEGGGPCGGGLRHPLPCIYRRRPAAAPSLASCLRLPRLWRRPRPGPHAS